MFTIQRFGDKHLSKHWVDTEYLVRWLVCSHTSNAVSDWDVLVLVWTNLNHKERGAFKRLVKSDNASQWTISFFFSQPPPFPLTFSLYLHYKSTVFIIHVWVWEVQPYIIIIMLFETWYWIFFTVKKYMFRQRCTHTVQFLKLLRTLYLIPTIACSYSNLILIQPFTVFQLKCNHLHNGELLFIPHKVSLYIHVSVPTMYVIQVLPHFGV